MGDTVSIIGYHKTTRKRAEKILAEHSFPISYSDSKRQMWLGDGIYFWHYLEDAAWWNKDDYEFGTILSALIECDRKDYLNLDLPEDMKRISDYADAITGEDSVNHKSITFKDRIHARAAFCTMFKKEYGIKLMRFYFPDDLRYNRAGFKASHGGRIQYCATSMECIHDIRFEANTVWDKIIGEDYGYI